MLTITQSLTYITSIASCDAKNTHTQTHTFSHEMITLSIVALPSAESLLSRTAKRLRALTLCVVFIQRWSDAFGVTLGGMIYVVALRESKYTLIYDRS